MTTTVHFDDLASLIGTPLGATEWMTISQDRINTFADATGDPQWIHVDPERATRKLSACGRKWQNDSPACPTFPAFNARWNILRWS